MYNFKKIAALGLALTMALGSSLTVFAEEEPEPTTKDYTAKVDTAKEVVGTGAEDYVDKNVMKVTMPTDTLIAKAFDYRLDPQGLIAKAKSYAGTPVTGTATGMVFLNNNKGKYTISNTSDAFTITNKSSIPVDLGVEVKLEAAAQAPMALTMLSTTSDFSADGEDEKAIYLGLKATNDVERALSGTAITPDAILLSGESQYTSTWDGEANKYVWAAPDTAKFSDFTFTITGAINNTLPNSTWASISGDVGSARTITLKNPPKVSLKIKLTPVVDALPLTIKWTTDSSKNDVLQVGMTNAEAGKGGFAADALPTAIVVNGRTVDTDDVSVDANGFLLIPLEKIYANYKTDWGTAVAKDKTAIKALIKNVKTTFSSGVYYGQF